VSPASEILSDPDGGPMARWPITATSPTIDHLGNLNGIEESAYNLNTGDLRDPNKCQNKYVANLMGWESDDQVCLVDQRGGCPVRFDGP